MKLGLITIALLAIGCSRTTAPPKSDEAPCLRTVTVSFGASLNDSEKRSAVAAMQRWSWATGGRACFRVAEDGGKKVVAVNRPEDLRRYGDDEWKNHVGLQTNTVIAIVRSEVGGPYTTEAVFVHEFGHALGLRHSFGGCMSSVILKEGKDGPEVAPIDCHPPGVGEADVAEFFETNR